MTKNIMKMIKKMKIMKNIINIKKMKRKIQFSKIYIIYFLVNNIIYKYNQIKNYINNNLININNEKKCAILCNINL